MLVKLPVFYEINSICISALWFELDFLERHWQVVKTLPGIMFRMKAKHWWLVLTCIIYQQMWVKLENMKHFLKIVVRCFKDIVQWW